MTSPVAQEFRTIPEGADPLPRPKKSADVATLAQLAALMAPAKPSEVFATYWRFACERQRIFARRFAREPAPWTADSVLLVHRFTNVYRVTDRVSQYLIDRVQYHGKWSPADLLFRTLLFKLFNRIDTWELLQAELGEPTWDSFSTEKAASVLDAAMDRGQRIYSAAYIMPSGGPRSGYLRKQRMHLALLSKMMEDRLYAKLAAAKAMETAFGLLRAYPTIGDFLAYQYVTDLNYSELTEFREDEFVVAGPGALEGIAKCFLDLGGKGSAWIIQRVAEVQDAAFAALDLPFLRLGNRPLQYIDCQNIFCEVAKYARVRHPEFNVPSGRTKIKQRFVAEPKPIVYQFPPKWKLQSPILPSLHVARD